MKVKDYILVGLPVVVGVLLTSLVLLLVKISIGEVAPLKAIVDVLQSQFSSSRNLFVIALFNALPFLALSFVLKSYTGKSSSNLNWFRAAVCLVAMIIPFCWMHLQIWGPVYRQEGNSSAELGFLLTPIYCTVALVIALSLFNAMFRLYLLRKLHTI